MTLNGAIKQLHELRNAEDIPFYYKPAIAEVINVLLMDTQEVRHGRWIIEDKYTDYRTERCSACGFAANRAYIQDIWHYCPNCGSRMDL